MYPSGTWIGFWQQTGVGRQGMKQFELHFQPDGRMKGHGVDVVGLFDITGTWNKQSGAVVFIKQYRRKHSVEYIGTPDGEGSIHGTWRMDVAGYTDSGSFSLMPHFDKPTGTEPVTEIRP
jgi:hypothetical protein